MPVYEFKCNKCGEKTEVNFPFSVKKIEITSKHECGGEWEKIFSKPNIIYRGSGFYTTDKVLYDPDPDEIDD